MINVIIPMNGESLYTTSSDFIYPKILTEVGNKTLFEYSQLPFLNLKEKTKVIYTVSAQKSKEFGLESIIKVISKNNDIIVNINGETKGALCTCLLAIDHMDLSKELIISSADQYLNEDLDEVLNYFRKKDADAGVLTFESVHPKWSYVALDENGVVKQSAEKCQISRMAITGFVYFKRAQDFIDAAMNVIRKQCMIEGRYYISSCLNELVLLSKKIYTKPLSDGIYFNFYDSHAIRSFEQALPKLNSNNLKKLTRRYIRCFDAKDLDGVMSLFSPKATLKDPGVDLKNSDEIRAFLTKLFASAKSLQFIEKSLIQEKDRIVIEFELELNNEKLKGTDIIHWKNGKIISLEAYLYSYT